MVPRPGSRERPGSRARKRAKLALAHGSNEAVAAPPAVATPRDDERARRPERYAFAACDADHAETPRIAYEHLAPLLARLGARLGKAPSELRIYDPYYCAGSVVRHLRELGFSSVHNANEDFYARARARDLPPFDVLVTNPPYTSDHVERLLAFCAAVAQPCCLLLPSYVYTKPYYASGPFGALRPLFLVPPCRYKYRSPPGASNAAGAVRKSGSGSSGQVTAPFPSFWYLKLPEAERETVDGWWRADTLLGARQGACAGCVLARSPDEVPHAMRDAADPARRRAPPGERARALSRRRTVDGRRLCTACGQVWGHCRHTRAAE